MTGGPVAPSSSPVLERAHRAVEYRAEGRRITAVQTQNCTQTATVSQIAAVATLDGIPT
ncbi:hypothetical protein AB0C96_08815 [Streptomyces sp. NPDC048506]|uniref:hypothetical protein n=1 Tax=Streptomyces sp. NPDC048506 TaxID=3155028 RepID=UPI00343BFABA